MAKKKSTRQKGLSKVGKRISAGNKRLAKTKKIKEPFTIQANVWTRGGSGGI